uniref:USP domain-containing protein n=1 Tax=Equus asinus TaxID=9793 RepID=A0A9L0KCV8_EQUAS
MFGDLFEEDDSSVSHNQYGKGKKLKTKAVEPPPPREFTNLSGIRNQGGTCYLNSLLQTLHFTPEFRESFSWIALHVDLRVVPPVPDSLPSIKVSP